MKKSTIIVLAIVYIVSFFLIGLLGQAVRAYDPVVYPEEIVLHEPDGVATEYRNVSSGSKTYDYYYVVKSYYVGMSITLRAEVKPDNTSFPNVNFNKDEQNTSFTLVTSAENPSIENNYAIITPTETDFTVLTTRFTVSTQTPGSQIKLLVGVTFMNN